MRVLNNEVMFFRFEYEFLSMLKSLCALELYLRNLIHICYPMNFLENESKMTGSNYFLNVLPFIVEH